MATPTQRLDEALLSPDLEEGWQECLTTWPDARPEEMTAVYGHVAGVRDHLANLARQVDPGRDGDMLAALAYLHLRTQWTLLNLQINYGAARGDWDESLIYRAALLSALVGAAEGNLGAETLARLRGLFAELAGGQAPEPAPAVSPSPDGAVDRIGELLDALHAQRVEAEGLRRRWEALAREVGAPPHDPSEVTRFVRALSERCYAAEARLSGPGEATRKGQAAELATLRAERELLLRECGEADVKGVVRRLREQRDHTVSLCERLGVLEAQRLLLAEEAGVTDPDQLADAFRTLRRRADTAFRGFAALLGDVEEEFIVLGEGGGAGAPVPFTPHLNRKD